MVDVVDKATRSRMMSGIRGGNTTPEMAVRRFLHSKGLRYRLHVKNLPGKPDLIFPKHKMALFVHGCFWHPHEKCKYSTTPKTNDEFWLKKFDGNIRRDKETVQKLKAAGWRVAVTWECEISEVKLTQLFNKVRR